MSRYYRVVISPNPNPIPGFGAGVSRQYVWTNYVNNMADLGAQTVEFDINVQAFDAPVGYASLRIWGPSKEQISQAFDFNGSKIEVYAGMQKGLPLANYAVNNGQAGLLLSGAVFQAFGNWQGINQTLDFVITTDGGATQSNPANLAGTWPKGERMSTVIRTVLQAAYPGAKIKINISDKLVASQDQPFVYQTVQQFSKYVNGASLDILGQNNAAYQGVSIIQTDGEFIVSDGTADANASATAITVQDLVGQPTWLSPYTIAFSTLLRADLSVMDRVTFPPIAAATALTTGNSGSNVRNKNAFTGDWTITYVRHIGNSRAPDPLSWITNFQAVSNQAPGDLTSIGNTSA